MSDEIPVPPPDPAPPKERRSYRTFVTPEQKLAKHRAIREAAEARQKAREAERRQALIDKRKVSRAATAALAAAMKAEQRRADAEDTPERQAERKAERQARGKAKGQPRLPGRQRAGTLTAQDVAIILALTEKKATLKEIAEVLNIGADTVARALADFADTRPLAKAYLRKQAETIAQHAVQASGEAALKGDADPALELLDRLDVAPKREESSDKSKVMIIVGGNSISALPTFPVLDAVPST